METQGKLWVWVLTQDGKPKYVTDMLPTKEAWETRHRAPEPVTGCAAHLVPFIDSLEEEEG